MIDVGLRVTCHQLRKRDGRRKDREELGKEGQDRGRVIRWERNIVIEGKLAYVRLVIQS